MSNNKIKFLNDTFGKQTKITLFSILFSLQNESLTVEVVFFVNMPSILKAPFKMYMYIAYIAV